MGGDKVQRHNEVCDILFLATRGATLSVEREQKHLLLHSRQKPADLLILNFSKGFHASAFDVAVLHILQSTSLNRATVDTPYIAQVAHEKEM